jgi:hypothetical protein
VEHARTDDAFAIIDFGQSPEVNVGECLARLSRFARELSAGKQLGLDDCLKATEASVGSGDFTATRKGTPAPLPATYLATSGSRQVNADHDSVAPMNRSSRTLDQATFRLPTRQWIVVRLRRKARDCPLDQLLLASLSHELVCE